MLKKIAIYFLYFFIFLIPYTFFVAWLPADTVMATKIIYFQILTSILFLLWAVLAIWNTNFRISLQNPFFYLALFFLFFAFLANLQGIDFLTSFWGNTIRYDGFVSWIFYFLYYLVILSSFNNKKIWIYFFYNLLFIGIIISFLGLILHLDSGRIFSVLANPIYLANFLVFELFFAFLLIIFHKIKNKRLSMLKNIFLTLSIILFFWTLLETETRGAVIALIGGVVGGLFFYAIVEQKNIFAKKISILFSLLIIISVFFSALFLTELKNFKFVQETNILNRLANISMEDETTRHRIANWSVAIEGWKDKPWFGYGQENYGYVYIKYYNNEQLYDNDEWFDKSHNVFLDYLVNFGIIGLLLFLAILFLIFYGIWKNNKIGNLGKSILIALLVSYILKNITFFDTFSSYIYFYILLAFVSFLYFNNQKNIIINLSLAMKKIITIIVIFIFILLFYISIQSLFNINKLNLFLNFSSNNRIELKSKNIQANIMPIINSLDKISYQQFVFLRIITYEVLIKNIYFLNNQNLEIEKKYWEVTNKIFNLIITEQPFLIRSYFYQALMFRLMTKYEKEQGIYKRMLKIFPNNYYIVRKIISSLVLNEKDQEAWKYIVQYEKYVKRDPQLKKYYKILKEKFKSK